MGSDPIAEIDDGLVETAAEIRQSLSDRRRINDRNPSGDSQLAVDVAADR